MRITLPFTERGADRAARVSADGENPAAVIARVYEADPIRSSHSLPTPRSRMIGSGSCRSRREQMR